ncbi:hypothetical protein [Kitasatospora sp. A2-31]|uniref:hypothetical protein n=1 Tax=Kitasatospora sp. A2-31 TaxID=2916414 RepID=UPI001EE8A715|nr:hypothetical protein [Kitasatospora sp. A2-31]MCG6493067.1 hypothetical protein [Kitasatospora sp. A2-31]
MTDDQIIDLALEDGNSLLLDPALPFPERVGAAVRSWEAGGRGSAGLVDGKAFFALRCWESAAARRGEELDGPTADYVRRSYDGIGGRAGWDALLRRRTACACHGDTWRLENVELCLGCLRYLCYQLDGPCCEGAEIVG